MNGTQRLRLERHVIWKQNKSEMDRPMQETVEDGLFFCFQDADSEVNFAKIIQTEVTFAKRKLNLLFTFITS